MGPERKRFGPFLMGSRQARLAWHRPSTAGGSTELKAMMVTITPSRPATVKTSAMPRAGPVPNQPPISAAPAPWS